MERCRSCGSEGVDVLGSCLKFARPEHADFSPGRLLRCPDCLLVLREPAPTADELLKMYRSDGIRPTLGAYEKKAAWGAARKMLTHSLVPKDAASILDIGCHSGGFLAGLPSHWRRFGVEAEGQPAAIARAEHGVELIAERIESVPAPWHGAFDAVTMFDVIEHLLDPREGLLSAARLLKPGGLMIFSTCDHDAWTWRWLDNEHWYLQTPQHLAVISRRYVKRLSALQGWQIQELRTLPARRESVSERMWQLTRLIYWGTRNRRGGWRVLRWILHSLPGCRELRHMNSVPWTLGLGDHLIAAIRT